MYECVYLNNERNEYMRELNIIEKQKSVAKEFLNLLEITDPNCILAGGAPRDWWLDLVANDLDFYVYWGEHTTVGEDEMRLTRLGFTPKRMQWNEQVLNYGTIPELRRVYEIDFKGEKIQVMVMSKPTFTCVIDRFGVSVSKAWFKGESIRFNEEFLLSHLTKVCFLKDNYNAKETYVEKITRKFPDYVMTKYSDYEIYNRIFGLRCNKLSWKIWRSQSVNEALEYYKEGIL